MKIYFNENNIGKRINPRIQKLKMVVHNIMDSIKYKKKGMFFRIEVETNTACNRRCSYCPNSTYDRGLIKTQKLMDKSTFYKLISDLESLKFKGMFCPVFYGEPFLDKRLPELLDYVRKKLPKAFIHISTNGDLLSVENYKKIRGIVDRLEITQHSKTMSKNVSNVLKYRKKDGKDNIQLHYSILSEKEELFNRGGLVDVEKTITMTMCNSPSETVTIDYKGNVVLCCNDYLSSIKWGNIKKESLLSIWNNPTYSKLRTELRKGVFKLDICKRCAGLK